MNDDRQTIREQLSAYLDGELSPDQVVRLEQAVEADPGLAKELAGLQLARDAVGNLPRQRAGEDFVSRILEQAERAQLADALHEEDPMARWRWLKHGSLAAAVLIFLILAGTVTFTLWRAPSARHQLPGGDAGDIPELSGEPEPPRRKVVDVLRMPEPQERTESIIRKLAVDQPAMATEGADRPPARAESGIASITAAELAPEHKVDQVIVHDADRMTIRTADIALAQREVEAVLLASALEPVIVLGEADDELPPPPRTYYIAHREQDKCELAVFVSAPEATKLQAALAGGVPSSPRQARSSTKLRTAAATASVAREPGTRSQPSSGPHEAPVEKLLITLLIESAEVETDAAELQPVLIETLPPANEPPADMIKPVP